VISGAREARPSWLRRLVARAAAREFSAIVVPGPELARALGLDLEAAGLRLSDTPRHASVLVLVGELPEGLKKAAAVAYAQMPRPRAIFAVGAGDVSPLPEPDVSVPLSQEDVASGVDELRRSFREGAFAPEAPDFDVDVLRTQTQYVCPMHPEVVRGEPGSCPICGMDLVPRDAAGDMDHSQMDHGHMHHERSGHEGMNHGGMDHGDPEGHGDARAAGEGEEHRDAHNEHEMHEHGGAEPEEHRDHHGHEETGHEDLGGEHGAMQHAGTDHGERGGHDGGTDGHDHEGDGEHEHTDHGHMDHSGHEGMDRGHEGRDQASREHPGHGGHDDTDHRAMDHGGDSGSHEAHGHGETRPGSNEGHHPQGGAHHEDMEHGGCEGHAGMEHEEAAEGHGTHDGMNHAHMDHGGMGFMSMVEMTKDLPRSSDGLPMEWVEAPFGPLFPGLPGGLSLTLTLDGDTVAQAKAQGVDGRDLEGLAGPVEAFADRLAQFDPLAPVAYRVLALRAVESAAGTTLDGRTVFSRLGALERERASSHLNWLAIFAHLLGYGWLERRAGDLQLALLRATDAEEVGRLAGEVRSLRRRVERTTLLRRKLKGIGPLSGGTRAFGPVARAGGSAADTRMEEEAYRELGFEPVVHNGNDAFSRLLVRIAEIEQSLDLVRKAGSVSTPEGPREGVPPGTGTTTVETPRGAATLRVIIDERAVSAVELETPSTAHLGLVEDLVVQRELADALVGVASLDLSPWEVAR
jgi:Ni,Fe-hydrogenase III large subunit